MVLTYYGNGPTMADIITSVVYVMNSSDYSTILQIMLILAGALMITRWHTTHVRGGLGGHTIIASMLMIATLYYGAWSPKTDVVVRDPINNFQTAVNNIPEGIAVVLWSSNRITNGFADLFDAAFTSSGFPSNFDYENTGGTLPGILSVTCLANITPNNAYLLMSIENYLNNCYMTAVLLGLESINDIPSSTNLLSTIDTTLSSAWTGTYYSATYPNGEQVSCSTLYDNIVNDLNNATGVDGTAMKKYADFLRQVGVPKIVTTSDASNLLYTAGNYLLNAGVSSQQMLAQAILINALNPQLMEAAARSGANPEAFTSALTQSALNTTTTMVTSYALASVFLPMSFLVVNSFVIAILPMLFAMMFIPQLTRKYSFMIFDLLMWLAFWSPIASIVNYAVNSYARWSYSGIAGHNITYQSFSYLIGHGHVLMAVAGDIMFSVPVIAFAFASASAYAMTSVAGSVAGLSKAAAGAGSARMATMGGAQSEQAHGMEAGRLGEASSLTGEGTKTVALETMDSQAASTAAQVNAIKRMTAKGKANAETNNALESLGHGTGLGTAESAARKGRVEGKEAIGAAQGLYAAYEQYRGNGGNKSFVDWAAMQSQYKGANTSNLAKNMQKEADEYFNGNLDALMRTVTAVEAAMRAGGAMGEERAYEHALLNGFTGSLTDFERFQSEIPSRSLFGRNVSTQKAANALHTSIERMTEAQRIGSNERAYFEGKGYSENLRAFGEEALFGAAVNNIARNVGQGSGYRNKEKAFQTGLWDAQADAAEADLEKRGYGTALRMERIKMAATYNRSIGAQMPAALTSDSKSVVDTYNKENAQWLKTAGKEGALVQAASAAEAITGMIDFKGSRSLENAKIRSALAQLAVSLAAQGGVGFKFLGNSAGIKGSVKGDAQREIKDMLQSKNGVTVARNILKEALMRDFAKHAINNPDSAFLHEHKTFWDLNRVKNPQQMYSFIERLAGDAAPDQANPRALNNDYNNSTTPGGMGQQVLNDAKQFVNATVRQYRKTIHTASNVIKDEVKEQANKIIKDAEKPIKETVNKVEKAIDITKTYDSSKINDELNELDTTGIGESQGEQKK